MSVKGPKCHEAGICGEGSEQADILIVGIAPGGREMLTGRPFTGPSGNLLNNFLKACGWDRSRCYLTNLVCTQNTEPTLEQIMECRPRFLAELELIKPKLVILLGQIVTNFFMPNQKFGNVRGAILWHPPFNCHVMSTFHPAACLQPGKMSASLASDIVFDLKKIKMFMDDLEGRRIPVHAGIPISGSVAYSILNTPAAAQICLDSLPRDKPIALDVETSNPEVDEVDVFDDNLLSVAISDGAYTWAMDATVAKSVKWPTDVQWTFHYGAFDSQIMMKIGADLPIVHDSLLAHFAIDERSGKHRLKPLTREYAYADFYELNRKKLGQYDLETTLEYNAKDAAYTARLLDRFTPMMHEDGVYGVYRDIMLPAANVFKYMQNDGLKVDRQYLASLALEWIPLYAEKEAALRKKVIELGGPPDINFDSPKQLSNFLFGTLKLPGGPSTAKDVLELLADEHPFVNDLTDLRHLVHLLSTYIYGIRDDIKKDDCVHPAPLLHGTVGGRCSYSNPPINTIPRPYSESPYGPKLRKLFVAEDDDHLLLEVDYRQAEIWMAYAYSQDKQLLEDLLTGDMHTAVAAFIAGIPLEQVTKAQRSDAKKTTFGKIYLIGDYKLAKQVKKSLGEAIVFSRLWDARYATYIKYTDELWNTARTTGEVCTLTGRKRRFPLIMDAGVKNQVVNFPIQATSHDCVLSSITEGYHELKDVYGCRTKLDVHDAALFQVRKDNWRDAARRIKEIWEKPRFPGLPSIPVELKLGRSWGSMEEVEI